MKGTVLGYKRFDIILCFLYLLFLFHQIIFNYVRNRGRRNQYEHTSLLKIEGVNDKEASNFYLGKRVAYIYKSSSSKSGSKFRAVWGKITRGHGSNGVVKAKFKTNLPVRYENIFHILIFFLHMTYFND